jgi:nucleoside-diphosphate-sugar epimerase
MLAAVTGASGHLGANLVRALITKEWKVRALVHCDTRAFEGLPLELVVGDVLDKLLEELMSYFTSRRVYLSSGGIVSRLTL